MLKIDINVSQKLLVCYKKTNSKEALNKLIKLYISYINILVNKFSRNTYDIEDVKQECLIELWQAIDRYNIYSKASLSTYIYKAIEYKILTYYSSNKYYYENVENIQLNNIQLNNINLIQTIDIDREIFNYDLLCLVVDVLEENKIKIIFGRYYDNMTWSDIAEELDLSKTTIYYMHKDAIEELNTHIHKIIDEI